MQNGPAPTQRDSVAEIKAAAREQAQKAARGASAITLLRTARDQIHTARAKEGESDLRGALSALTKAVSLAQLYMDTTEMKQEISGKKGSFMRDLLDFQQREGHDLKESMARIEGKLVEIDTVAAREFESEAADGTVSKASGGSIADRMRALQSAGLSVGPAKATSKRISKDLHLPSLPSTPVVPPTPTLFSPSTSSSMSYPVSPEMPKSQRMSLQNLPSPLLPSPSITSPSIASPSPHTLIPVSSFGPPSPTSSASSSPRVTNRLSLTDFSHAFPSIDELDEMDALRLPAVKPLATGSSKHSPTDDHPLEGSSPIAHSPIQLIKPFPIRSIDPGPRPSSTPIPSVDNFNSRPASPTRSPLVPRKPSNLALNGAARSPLLSQVPPPIPHTLFPGTLHEYMGKNNFEILILDVRTREEFDREHIKADAIICIEPSVLLRENVSAEAIENSLAVAPRQESILFSNRDKFDLVAVYDESSTSFNDSPALKALMGQIYEVAFKKILKNIPMVLVGGLGAWKAQFPNDVVHGGSETTLEVPGPATDLMHAIDSSPGVNGHMSPMVPLPSPPSLVSSTSAGHARLPAESSTRPSFVQQPMSPPFAETSNFTRTVSAGPSSEPHEYKMWVPPPGAGTPAPSDIPPSLRPGFGSRDIVSPPFADMSRRPLSRPVGTRPPSQSVSYQPPPIPPTNPTHRVSPSLATGISGIQYPQFNRTISPQMSGSSFSSPANGLVSLPPQASINPSPLRRRTNDYIDQSQEALQGISHRPPIDYPELSSQHILRPPPAVASSSLERQDNRPRIMSHAGPKPPTIPSDYPVTYWADIQIGTSGLKNLGNTCYMNSTIQCLSATVPFARFFTDGRWKSAVNMVNPMGTKGQLAQAFANIIRDMWQGEMASLTPLPFRRTVCTYAKQFAGSEQHDSQEFLASLLDGLHEDLNRVLNKPHLEMTPEREAELEKLPTQLASEQQWQMYRMRDDSPVVDFFQGQYRSRLECLTCHHTSTTYNTFMYLTLPIPTHRTVSKVTIQQCLDAFVKEEIMEKSDAWHCPNCKVLRKATKLLSLARLPPVLLIHLKRFSVKGHFTEKIETPVDFPLKGLDLTNYMPPPLPPGVGGIPNLPADDPRAQLPPYKYDLYGVTNHFGTLSSGHYTAFISSRGGWLYCDDSRITPADPKDVVGKPAYILFYKRIKA
ncbi:cysteine proteinase [Trametopsis cervina]|nr:cysteine proteinase [Trametopsis cervina]